MANVLLDHRLFLELLAIYVRVHVGPLLLVVTRCFVRARPIVWLHRLLHHLLVCFDPRLRRRHIVALRGCWVRALPLILLLLMRLIVFYLVLQQKDELLEDWRVLLRLIEAAGTLGHRRPIISPSIASWEQLLAARGLWLALETLSQLVEEHGHCPRGVLLVLLMFVACEVRMILLRSNLLFER